MATYDEQILGAKQQAELARKLRESATAPQGQMVSGWHVAPSPTQYAAELMKAYYGRQGETAAQDKLASILKERETKGNELLAQMPQTRTVPEQVTPTFESGTNQMVANALRGGQEQLQAMPQGGPMQQNPSMMASLIRGEQPQQMPIDNVPLPQQTGQTVTPAQTIVPTDVDRQKWLMQLHEVDPAKAQIAAKMMEMQAARESTKEQAYQSRQDKAAEAEKQRLFLASQNDATRANAMAIVQSKQGQNGGVYKPRTQQQMDKFKSQIAEDFKTVGQTVQNVTNMTNDIRAIRGSEGLEARTGYSAYLPAAIQGEDAKVAENRIQSLKGKVTQMGKQIAAASGSLGSMAVAEWKIVSDAVEALDPTAKNFNEQLDSILFQAEAAAKRMRDTYERQYQEDLGQFPAFDAQNLPVYTPPSKDGKKDGKGTQSTSGTIKPAGSSMPAGFTPL